jgi:hypothetical protein
MDSEEEFDIFYYFWYEQNWRVENILNQIDDILDELADIRLALLLDEACPPPREFDPFQTIGKY